MDNIKKVDIADLAGQQIPEEILEQLKVFGRVQYPLGKTVTSAVSTSAGDIDQEEIDELATVSGLIAHVASMEDLATQIEDMIDDLTADMNIPVPDSNRSLQDAVTALGGDGAITRDVFDKAQSLLAHAQILTNGYDPVMAALNGNGKIQGDYLDCDQVTRSIAATWNTPPPNEYAPEDPIKDEASKIADDYEQNLGQMIIEILQNMFFNMIWPKYLVDLAIINPIRILVANPVDSLICFFKNFKKKEG
jgi:hypothetical protein